MPLPIDETTIFLVDDDPFCLSVMEGHLKEIGYPKTIPFAHSADLLHQLIRKPDLIFLDYAMDNLNGIDILKKIKRFDPDLPVIFVSGQEKIGIAVNALKYGAFDYIIKEELCKEKLQAVLQKLSDYKATIASRKRKNLVDKVLHLLGL